MRQSLDIIINGNHLETAPVTKILTKILDPEKIMDPKTEIEPPKVKKFKKEKT